MPVGGYTSRWGDGQGGGGYANWACADSLNAGHYAVVGDVWGPRYTVDGGNSWHACGRGLPGSNGVWPNGRSCMISKRAATSGLEFYLLGSAHGSDGGGGFYASPMGSGDLHAIDTVNGPGQSGYGGTGAGSGPNGEAIRPNGQHIESIMASGTEYLFTITTTGVHRYTSAGSSWASIPGTHFNLVPASMLPGLYYAISICVIDNTHLYVGLWDHNKAGAVIPSKVYLVTTNQAHFGAVTNSATQITVTDETPSTPKGHIYHAKKGKDGLFHVGCGYDGAYQFTLSGGHLTWTADNLAGGSPSSDVLVSSVDTTAAGLLWAGQSGGNAAGTYSNDSAGTPAGHAVIKAALSGGNYTYSFPASGAAVHGAIYKPGDGATASGPTWFLFANGPALNTNAADIICVIVDPFDDTKVTFTGRSGSWQTRNSGTGFYPAMQGQAGTEVRSGLHQTGARSVVAGIADFTALQTTDDWHTAARGSSVPAGGGVSLKSAGLTSFVGQDGATYTFTQATASTPLRITRSGVQISDPESEASLIAANTACASANGVLTIGQNGGGVYVLEPSTAPAPVQVTGFTPTTQAIGSTVAVTGKGFTGATSVQVNGVVCTTYTVNSDTSITLTVPAGSSPGGRITVVSPLGTGSSTGSLTVSGGGGGGAPTFDPTTPFTPTSGIVGDTITVTGTNLATTTGVTVNGIAASFTAVSSTTLTLVIPAGASTGKIGITTPAGTVLSGSNLTVTVPAAPTITSFTPTTGAIGTTITITGDHFTGASSVKVGGISAVFTVVNSTTITFTIPSGAPTGQHVQVVTAGGSVTSSGTLTVSGAGGGADAFVQVLDKQAPTGTGTTLTLTIPTGGVPVGHSIIIVAGSNHTTISGITDTGSNTYQSDEAASASSFLSGAIYSAAVTTALLAGDTITITYSGSVGGRCAVAAEYQYLLSSSWNDAPVSGNTANVGLTTTSSTKTGGAALAQANEIVISGLILGGTGASAGTISVGTGWNLRGQVEQASGTIRAAALAGRQTTAIETPSATFTWGSNDGYLQLITSYKISPPSGGGGGGSGVAPVIRQSTPFLAPTAPQTAPTLAIGAWPNPTLAGSRIVVEVGIANNQTDGIGASVSGGSGTYQQTSQSPAVRQSNPTGGGAHDQLSLRQFQKLNCAAASPSPTVAFTGLPGAGVYVWAVAHEITGSHLTLAEDLNAAAKAVGASATPTVTAPGPSARDAILYLASIATGNADIPTLDAATNFLSVTSGSSSGASATGKAGGIILDKPQTTAGNTASAIADVTQTRNYAALLLAIPAPDTGTGGGVGGGIGGLDDTNNGVIHRHVPLQYWGSGITSTAGGNTALQNAQLLATMADIIVANVKETDSTAGTIALDRFHGLAEAMRLVKPNILLAPYGKSAQIDEGATYFPNTYYVHAVPWPTGAKIATGFSPSILIAQPTSPDQPSFVSPRGFTSASFAEYRGRDAAHTLATYNAIHGAGTLNSWFLDSAGPSTYRNQADPLNPTTTYPTRDSWLQGQVYKILDQTVTRNPGLLIMANGLISGPSYFTGLSAMMAHAHIGIAESWLRSNYTPFADTSWPSESDWQKNVDMVVDANDTQGGGVCLITNIANNTAGTPGSGYVTWTTPQVQQARRLVLGTYMLAKRSAAWVCFVPDAPTTEPWAEDDPWYHADLGLPLDNPTVDATGRGAALALKNGAVYQRRFTNGSVFVNPTSIDPVSFTLDRDYYLVASDGTRGALYGSAGATKTLAKFDAIMLYGTAPAGTNSSAPVVTIQSPLTGSTVSDPSLTTTATISDPDGDGIATAEARVGTSGAWTTATFNGASWSAALTLASGANTVQWRATDDNASPLTSTPVQITVTYTAVSPTAPVNSTPPSIPQEWDVGETQNFDPGAWTNNPTSYLYTLESKPQTGGMFVPIYIGSDPFYTPIDSDIGTVFQLVVVANNGADSLPASSNISDPVLAPSTVALDAEVEDSLGRVRLTIGAPPDARLADLTRQHPSGRVIPVRGCTQLALSGGNAVVWDYEAPINIPVTYTATVYTDPDTQLGQSDGIEVTWQTTQTWLKDPLEPVRNMPVTIRDMSQYTYDHRAGVHVVLGRPDAVTVGDIRSAAAGTVIFHTRTRDEYDRFQYLTSSGHALLLQDDQDSGIGSMYLAALGTTEERVIPTAPDTQRFFSIDYQEVRSPAGDGASFVTWADVVAQFPDWQAVVDAFPDWGSLIEGLSSTSAPPTLTWRGS